MPSERAQKTNTIQEYLDGSLAPEQMSEAERLIEHDPDVRTVLDHQDKLETFVSRLQEALAMPRFPAEQDDQKSEALCRALAAQIQAPPTGDVTAALNRNEPSVSTGPQMPAAPQHDGFAFLSPPQAADEIGRLGGYRILKLLGQGGMGMVFEAEDVRLKRRVALKVMKPEVTAKEEHHVRFLREAQTAAAVEHDFICPIYQVGEENGVPFIAMPFLKGEPLDARLKRQRPLPIAEAIRIGCEVAEGLAEAHKAGLVHRDIKPGNIWLECLPNGRSRCRILDFGLARSMGDDVHLTQSGAIMGTPTYMAPEQARARPVDHRADLFSLGVILYEMTTGQRPFTGGDTMSILTSLALDEPTAPNRINPAVPAELAELVMRLLAKAPENRPASSQAIAEALLEALTKTSRPVVKAMPGSAAPPRATSADRTTVDPCREIDHPISAETSPPRQPGESQVALAQPEREPAPSRGQQGRPAARPSPASGGRSRLGWTIFAASGLLLIGGGFAAYKLSFETKDGTLVVQVDIDADVRFKNGELQIFDADGKLKYTLAPSQKNQTLPPGKYLVKIVGADGVRLESPEFVMEKNGKVSVRVVADTIVIAKKGNGPKDESPRESIVTSAPPSLIGNALRFGANERVEITSFQDHDGPLTLEVCATVLKKSDTRNGWVIGVVPGASGRFSPGATVLHVAANGKWHLGTQGEKGNSTGIGTDALIGLRTHVAFVRTDKELRLFVDGKFIGAEPLSAKPARGRIMLGGGSFVGLLDGVRVSRTARYDKSFTPLSRLDKDADTWALYQFDEGTGDTLKDSSGNNHHGRIIGAKWVKTEAASPVNYALKFEEGEKIEVRNFALNAAKVFTLEAYVAVEELSPDTKRPWPGNGAISVVPGSICLGVVRTANKDRWTFRVCGEPGSQIQVNAIGPVEYKRLVHVAAVKADTELRFYIEGKLVDVKEWPGGAMRNTTEPSPLLLGSIFAGTLDEIRISKVARYDHEFTPQKRFEPDQDTIALYHCDEGAGDMLKDSSGNGHHGRLTGAKWVKADGSPIGFAPARFKNKLGMDFALVPKGKAWLGGGAGKAGDDEVEFKNDFYMGVYEVTQSEWEKIMGNNPSGFSRKGPDAEVVKEVADADLSRFPVENVPWDDCQAFLAKLNDTVKESGWIYRLPTDAEWEYACRGGPLAKKEDFAFHYYLDAPSNTLPADKANIAASNLKRTRAVGSYPPNRLGLHDMHGNVWEMCGDAEGRKPKSFRGGSWGNDGGNWASEWQALGRDFRHNDVGLRVARVPVGAR